MKEVIELRGVLTIDKQTFPAGYKFYVAMLPKAFAKKLKSALAKAPEQFSGDVSSLIGNNLDKVKTPKTREEVLKLNESDLRKIAEKIQIPSWHRCKKATLVERIITHIELKEEAQKTAPVVVEKGDDSIENSSLPATEEMIEELELIGVNVGDPVELTADEFQKWSQ